MLTELKPVENISHVVVLAIIKNEIFYLKAFLDYYRGLGVKQFIFLDDRSTDGSLELLKEQSDCAIVTCVHSYGEIINGKKAGLQWKEMLAKKYRIGSWALTVDLDEFVILPEPFDNIIDFAEFLDSKGLSIVSAVMVDFYPASILDLLDSSSILTAKELFQRYPYFDDLYHGEWINGENKFHNGYGGARDRLIHQFAIPFSKPKKEMSKIKSARRYVRRYVRSLVGLNKKKFFNFIHKVPLVKWEENYLNLNDHQMNVAPSVGLQLAIVHFKFTGSFKEKIDFAIISGSHSNNSSEYKMYKMLFSKMMDRKSSFLCKKSKKFTSASDFMPNKILRFDYDL